LVVPVLVVPVLVSVVPVLVDMVGLRLLVLDDSRHQGLGMVLVLLVPVPLVEVVAVGLVSQ